jgi:hypothetical protein
MQRSYCPTCRSPIGGENHASVAGVTRVTNIRSMMFVRNIFLMATFDCFLFCGRPRNEGTPGYVGEFANSVSEVSAGQRVSVGPTLVMRLGMHLLFEAACCILPDGAGAEIGFLVGNRLPVQQVKSIVMFY